MTSRREIDLSLPKSAIDEISILVDNADKLKNIIERSKKTKCTTNLSSVLRPLAKDASIDYAALRKLISALQNLNVLKKEYGSSELAFEKVSDALGSEIEKKWKAQKAAILSALEAYSDDNPVAITSKAERLAFLREHVFRSAEIITDARPVYDAAGEKVFEMIITHSLIVTFTSPGNVSDKLHFTMDAADVLKLRQACDRAIVKAKTLKSALDKFGAWPTDIMRDYDNGAK